VISTFAPERRAGTGLEGGRPGVRYAFPGTGFRGDQARVPGRDQIRRLPGSRSCHSGEQAEQIKVQLAEWLAPRGLVFNEDKTQIVHLGEQGFDFLGFNVRRYGSKLLIKTEQGGHQAAPATARVRDARPARIELGGGHRPGSTRSSRGGPPYYRGVVSSKVFHTLDYQMWKLTYKWTTWQHNNKPKRWIVAHYFGKRNKFRNDRWVFGDPGSDAYPCQVFLDRHCSAMSWFQGRGLNPMTPALADYWAERRRKVKPPVGQLHPAPACLARQDARCPLCGDHLLTAEQPPQSPNELGTMVGNRSPVRR